MDNKQIEKGNKSILLFMGGVVGSSTKYPTGEVIIHSIHLGDKQINDFINETKYHKSWDWIMPVVDKIMDIDITLPPNWTGFGMEIVPRGYVRIKGFPMAPAIFSNVSNEGGLLNAVWVAVVKFIEWHDENAHCLASSPKMNEKCGLGAI